MIMVVIRMIRSKELVSIRTRESMLMDFENSGSIGIVGYASMVMEELKFVLRIRSVAFTDKWYSGCIKSHKK